MKSKQLRPRAQKRDAFVRTLLTNLAVCCAILASSTAPVDATTAPALTISGKPPWSVIAGNQYSFRPTVTDTRTGRTLKFSIYGKPAWASFNTATGGLAGIPHTVGVSSNIAIYVTDGLSTAVLPEFKVTVTADPVKISGTPQAQVTAGKPYSFKPTASDSAGRKMSFSATNKPAWATFSVVTGLLSGTPGTVNIGTYRNVVISASDGVARAALPAFTVSVVRPASAAATLSQKYPGDVGLATDTAVVFHENFAEGSVAGVVARYDTTVHKAGMALVTDHPAGSASGHALRMTSGGSSGSDTTYLYKSFGVGYDELYFRYYAKYETTGPYHHAGLWFGGYNAPLLWPYPRAGTRPLGNERYSFALEPIDASSNPAMDLYTYWRGMHSWMATPTNTVGAYYGNTLLHDREFRLRPDAWVCYEVHLKLNPDVLNGTGAVLQVWENDSLVRTFDDTGPHGYWVRDKFCPLDSDAVTCTAYRPANPTLVPLDQRWRTTTALKINYFWPQNYNTSTTTSSSLLLADMVVAKQRIGCTVN